MYSVVLVLLVVFVVLFNSYLETPYGTQEIVVGEVVDIRTIRFDDVAHIKEKDYRLQLLNGQKSRTVVYDGNPVHGVVLSPNHNKIAVLYSPQDRVSILKILDVHGNTTAEWMSDGMYLLHIPRWAGSRYVYTERGCGTACIVMLLLDTETNEKQEGFILQVPKENGATPIGYMQDWFGKEHYFEEVVGDVAITQNKDDLLLTLQMQKFDSDYNLINAGERTFVVTETEMIEVRD